MDVSPLIESLTPWVSRLAPRLAARALELGLAVTGPEGDVVPIATTLSPVVVADRELDRRRMLAAHLAEAGVKMARALLQGPHRELLLGGLSPLERRFAEERGDRLSQLAISRVDFFLQGETARALEINSTIPAMPGYSDIAVQALLETVGTAAGLTPAQVDTLRARNGSNASALLEALRLGFRSARPGHEPERVALLCRRNDPQISELRYCAARFNALGLPAEVVYPDEVIFEGRGLPEIRGQHYDLIYRHLFVRRLEQLNAPQVELLFQKAPLAGDAVVLNPPSTPVEVKAVFALLSQSAGEPALAQAADLNEAERAAIAESVPWTRWLRAGPGTDPDGKRVPDLIARVAAEPARFVLKRSWEYGGRAVFVGATEGEAGFSQRSEAAFGKALPWAELVRRAAEDTVGGGFVAQEHIPVHAQPHWLCSEQGAQEVGLFVDYSAYASVGLEHQPHWGGVCRGSTSQVVNIVGGGGVLPLLRESVARALTEALQRVQPLRAPRSHACYLPVAGIRSRSTGRPWTRCSSTSSGTSSTFTSAYQTPSG